MRISCISHTQEGDPGRRYDSGHECARRGVDRARPRVRPRRGGRRAHGEARHADRLATRVDGLAALDVASGSAPRLGVGCPTRAVVAVAAATRLVGLAYPHELVFDETYYVKDAWTLMHLGYEGLGRRSEHGVQRRRPERLPERSRVPRASAARQVDHLDRPGAVRRRQQLRVALLDGDRRHHPGDPHHGHRLDAVPLHPADRDRRRADRHRRQRDRAEPGLAARRDRAALRPLGVVSCCSIGMVPSDGSNGGCRGAPPPDAPPPGAPPCGGAPG